MFTYGKITALSTNGGHNRSEKVLKIIDYLKGESQFQIFTGGGQ